MTRPTTRALIFDMDGVIADTEHLHYLSWQRVADEYQLPFSEAERDSLRGLSRRQSLTVVLGERAVDDATAARMMQMKNDFYHEFLAHFTAADRLPGVTALIEAAQAANLRLAVASSSHNVRTVLERLDLLHTFDALADAHCVVHTKPAPDLFLWAAGRLNINPREAIVFEDSTVGVTAALAGGFRVVGIGKADVSAAHLVVPDLTHLTLDEVLAL